MKRKILSLVLGLSVAVMFTAQTPQALAADTLFSNGFETNNFSQWSSADSRWTISSSDGHGGSFYKAEVAGDTGGSDDSLRKAVSTSGYRALTLSYWYRMTSMESSDHVYVEYSNNNGSSWLPLADYTNQSEVTDWVMVSHNLPVSSENNPQFQLRFRGHMNSSFDSFTLDDVSLQGIRIPSVGNSTVQADNNYVPTQGGVATIVISVKDSTNTPIAGIPASEIVVSATGSGNVIAQPTGVTSVLGQVTATIQSTIAGDKEVSVVVSGYTITQKPIVTFYTSQPVKANIVATPSATVEASLAGTGVDLDIIVTDSYGNNVPDGVDVTVSGVASTAGIVSVTGSGKTVSGHVARHLTFNNKGQVTLTVNAYSGNLVLSGNKIINFVDTTKPEITVAPPNPATVEYRGTYTDAGATATDNIDGDITTSIVTVNPVNPSVINVSPINTTDKIVAVYTVTYDVADSSGNNATQKTRTVNVVDTTPPAVLSLTSNATASGWLKVGDSIVFTLTTAVIEPSGTTVAGSYNGKALTWTTSDNQHWTATYTVEEGQADHKISPLQISGVTVTDEAGNVSVLVSGNDVAKLIDAHTPVAPVVNLPPFINIANKSSVPFSVTGEAGTTVNYTVGTMTFGPYPFTGNENYNLDLTGLPDGSVTASVTLTDNAGNVSLVGTDTATKDTVAPTTGAFSLASYINIGNQNPFSVNGTGEANAKLNITITDSNTTSVYITSGYVTSGGMIYAIKDLSGLSDGNVTFVLKLEDTAGNVSDVLDTETILKDTVKPTVVLSDNHTDNIVRDADIVTITATFVDVNGINEVTPPTISIHSVPVLVDNAVMTKVSNLVWQYEWDVPAGNDGTHTVTVSAKDVPGNTNELATGKTSYVIDNTAPVFTNTAPAEGAYVKGDYTVGYTLNEDLQSGSVEFHSPTVDFCTLAGENLLTGSHTLSNEILTACGVSLIEGAHTVTFKGTDIAGNPTSAPTNNFTYDVTNPTMLDVSSEQADGAYKAGVVIPIDVTASETVQVTGNPKLYLNSAIGRYAEYAGATDPSGSVEPLPSLSNVNQITNNTSDDSAVDTAERNGVVHRVYVRGGNIYYKGSGGEELVSAGSNPSIAVGPNGIPQVVFIMGGSIVHTQRSGSWSTPTIVGVNGGYGAPSLDVDSNNKAHVAFTWDSDGEGYADIVYSNNISGTFSTPINVLGSSYRSYHDTPVLKLDSSGYYHIIGHYHGMSCGGWGCDHSYSINYTTNAPGRAGSGVGRNIVPGNNSLTIDSSGNPKVVYSDGASVYYGIITADGTWSESTIVSGSSPSISSSGATIGVSYNNGGVKYVQNSGSGFGTPEIVDPSGSNQSLAMGDFVYVDFTKSASTPANIEVFEASNKPASSGAGTKLTFNYVVQAGDTSSDLDYTSTSALDLNGGSIKDLAGNNANLALATPGATHSLGANKNIVIDTTAPTVILTTTAPNPTNGTPIPVTATFSEPVTGFEIGDVTVGNGTAGNFAGSGTTYTFDVTPVEGTVTVNMAGGVASDVAGNGNTSATQLSIVYDITQPTVTTVTLKEGLNVSDGLVKAGDVLTVEVTFSEAMANSPVSTIAISGSNTLVATAMTKVDSTHYNYNYTVGAGDGLATITIADGKDLATNGLVVNSSTTFVVDNTKPVITVPANMTLVANQNGGRIVTYSATASDNHDTEIVPTCIPASGYKFPVSQTTTVNCNVTDQAGNAATQTSFTVTINPDVIAKLEIGAVTPVTVPGPSLVTVTGKDQYGNVVTNDSTTIVALSADNGGALAQTVLTLASGVTTTNLSKTESGDVHVTVTSGVLPPANTIVHFNPADTTGPNITSFSPTLNASDVSVTAPLFFVFSEPLKLSSVNSTNVQLWKMGSSTLDTIDTQVPATVSLVEGGMRVNISPVAALDYNSQYYFVVTNGVTDETGNILTNPKDWTSTGFTTAVDMSDHTAPTIETTNPLDGVSGVALSITPSITFSESLLASTVSSDSVKLYNGETLVPATVSLVEGGTKAVITPSVSLANNTTYHFVVTTGVTDEAGNALAVQHSYSFTTEVENVQLAVTESAFEQSFATPDDTWEHGWRWVLTVTAPTAETELSMKFADFVSGSDSIPAANNIRISSAQGTGSVTMDAANIYKGFVHLNSDLDTSTPGRQFKVMIEVKVPTGTPGGSYSTSYGIQTIAPIE